MAFVYQIKNPSGLVRSATIFIPPKKCIRNDHWPHTKSYFQGFPPELKNDDISKTLKKYNVYWTFEKWIEKDTSTGNRNAATANPTYHGFFKLLKLTMTSILFASKKAVGKIPSSNLSDIPKVVQTQRRPMNIACGRLTIRNMLTITTSIKLVELLSVWRCASRALFSLKYVTLRNLFTVK